MPVQPPDSGSAGTRSFTSKLTDTDLPPIERAPPPFYLRREARRNAGNGPGPGCLIQRRRSS